MTDPMTPARRDALLRLLADWEAVRMTDRSAIPENIYRELLLEGLIDSFPSFRMCQLTPAGLAAAQAAKGGEG